MLDHRFEMPGRLVYTLFKITCDYLKLPDLHFSSITGEFVRDSLVGAGLAELKEGQESAKGARGLARIGGKWLRVEGRG